MYVFFGVDSVLDLTMSSFRTLKVLSSSKLCVYMLLGHQNITAILHLIFWGFIANMGIHFLNKFLCILPSVNLSHFFMTHFPHLSTGRRMRACVCLCVHAQVHTLLQREVYKKATEEFSVR